MLYVLRNKVPVQVAATLEFMREFDESDRRVARDFVAAGGRMIRISTVFLGIDHNFSGEGPPILFETMTFSSIENDELADFEERCSTWDEAVTQHSEMVARILRATNGLLQK